MVSAQKEEVLGILDFVSEEEADGLEGLLSAVDVVTEEKIVGIGRKSSILKQSEQVIILTMDITCTHHCNKVVSERSILLRVKQ